MKSKEAIAMLFTGVEKQFLPTKTRFPVLKKGEVLVQNLYATLCTSDLHSYYGRRPACYPSILGHEIIGQIEEKGDNEVHDFFGHKLQIGDRVTWSVYSFNPESINARKGYPQKSAGLYKYGHEKISTDNSLNGGFASHCLLLENTSIFKLPENLNLKEAAPLNCTHATVAGALRIAGNLENKNVLINGSGMLGLSACAMAKENGAKNVWAVDLSEKKAEFALQFGADRSFAVTNSEIKLANSVSEIGGIDVIIETSGQPAAIEEMLKLLSIGGKMILVGSVFPQRDLSINAEYLLRNLLSISGLHNYVPEDLASAIHFVSEYKTKYPFEQLVGQEFKLHQLSEAFEKANSGQFFRVGILPQSV